MYGSVDPTCRTGEEEQGHFQSSHRLLAQLILMETCVNRMRLTVLQMYCSVSDQTHNQYISSWIQGWNFTSSFLVDTCNTMSTWKHTQRMPTQQQKTIITQKSSLPCKSGEGQPTLTKRSRARVRTAPGMVLDTVKPTFQSIVQNPPFKTKQDFFSVGRTKENQTPCLFDTYNYCNYTK